MLIGTASATDSIVHFHLGESGVVGKEYSLEVEAFDVYKNRITEAPRDYFDIIFPIPFKNSTQDFSNGTFQYTFSNTKAGDYSITISAKAALVFNANFALLPGIILFVIHHKYWNNNVINRIPVGE